MHGIAKELYLKEGERSSESILPVNTFGQMALSINCLRSMSFTVWLCRCFSVLHISRMHILLGIIWNREEGRNHLLKGFMLFENRIWDFCERLTEKYTMPACLWKYLNWSLCTMAFLLNCANVSRYAICIHIHIYRDRICCVNRQLMFSGLQET